MDKGVNMKFDELDLLKIGTKVIFNSSHPNPARRQLNGRMCIVQEWDDNYSKGWEKREGIGYKDDIIVFLEFIDDCRRTFASIDEFEIIT